MDPQLIRALRDDRFDELWDYYVRGLACYSLSMPPSRLSRVAVTLRGACMHVSKISSTMRFLAVSIAITVAATKSTRKSRRVLSTRLRLNRHAQPLICLVRTAPQSTRLRKPWRRTLSRYPALNSVFQNMIARPYLILRNRADKRRFHESAQRRPYIRFRVFRAIRSTRISHLRHLKRYSTRKRLPRER